MIYLNPRRVGKLKKIILFLLTVMLTSVLALSITYASERPNTLVVHYFRYDGNYTGYNMWLWQNEPTGLGGKQFNFTNTNVDEHGAYYEVDLEAEGYNETTKWGIIIKQGAWDGYREPGGDRFFKLSDAELINGKIHAYFVQADTRIGLSNADLANNIPDYRPNILFVAFNAQRNIVVDLTHPATSYKVYENDVQVKSGNFTTGLRQTITDLNIDLTKTYDLEVTFADSTARKTVSLQNLYDTPEFENAFTYDGELGAIYTKAETTFRLWAPVSQAVSVNIYNQGHPQYNRLGQASEEANPVSTHEMTPIENGVWEVKLSGDFASKYYTFDVTNNNVTNEVTDPYSYSTGANGLRSMVVDFDSTDPLYWDFSTRPNTIQTFTDYIIWELHVRDLTTHSSWNGTESSRGKFLGLAESGTTYSANGTTVTTGLDHIEELGVNAVHLLPIFDFGYIDEVEVFKNPNTENVFNWGYMPYHFNTLEGSYSTNPFDGNVRIYEFKQAVQAFHQKDIRVIMDVVYNHTGESEGSNFHKIVPGYFHRLNANGGFQNGSGTGNETASERSMVRKFMVDSTVFLAEEYKLSGFRFDLMSLHDIETMNAIREALNKIDPTIILYGEPWAGGDTLIDGDIAAGMTNTNGWDRTQVRKMDSGVGAFNDLYRNALKGTPDGAEGGFVQGAMDFNKMQDLRKGIMGATEQFTNSPLQNIVYGEAHDNLTLHDKLRSSGVPINEVKHAQVQSNAIVLTSMGIPFLHAGTEFLRSKPLQNGGYDHNSYESPDSVNQLRWDRKLEYNDVFEYHKALIHIRKTYQGLRMDNMTEINARFNFVQTSQDHTDKSLAYTIDGVGNQPKLLIIHAGRVTGTSVTLNDGKTYMMVTSRAGSQGLYDVSKGLVTRSGKFDVLTQNTTSIFVEVKSTDLPTLKSEVVTVALNEAFDGLSNVNVPAGATAYATAIDTSIPGFKVVTVSITDFLGNQSNLYYVANVSGGMFTNVLGGLS
ncbi:pullulanase, surface-anchored protein [Acholeplasma laidlawii PG-8A]|uniref:pullulanase n=1 Tax=Acholeplasma laidlawii (strain PG-8A) TaxID=441768 RepID=A9NG01_ACHLI|nr:pullulanase, surface-anchored protein [Acholeplasma laidlawii PG-8A]